ncbi:F-type H+-transporting ATPase subunit epsilon [Streptomyces sp. WMMB 714]|uniref:F0F1 ATP synthase subunit epsilon n=1 Tax=Streptomyces sp. WMMB 714 TaxID=1286822 RepID=UPI0005F7941C|nr:F0F1 ATP synthase subunit epsilon [Streptomyces sp. WMMB 714]SCK11178.1 F-type H+-transporting ATPase subunit epsilon [Streptomyces sp. WMMB 714]
MAELHVELVAADRQVWSGEASLVVARTTSGDIGVMPGHQPLLGVLEPGSVTIRTAGESGEGSVVAAVHGGFLSFADDKLSLLAEIAELADEIDVERAERALERAKSEADAAAERRAEVRVRAAAGR